MKKDKEQTFNYIVERFADLNILRYQVPGFEALPLNQKMLLYYLSQAACEGRDILYDQNYKHNLTIRKTMEVIYKHYRGDRTEAKFKNLEIYLKRIWFSNGIHHHYSTAKFYPDFTKEDLNQFLRVVPVSKIPFGKNNYYTFLDKLWDIIIDKKKGTKRVNLAADQDVIKKSANNYYGDNVTQKQAESFYNKMKDPEDKKPISYGLNSTLIKKDGKLVEEVWRAHGKYSRSIKAIICWLEKALDHTENDNQKQSIELLIKFYETGDLAIFDQYNIAWLNDHDSHIDFINGFIETYGDALGLKASWESTVNFKDIEATHRTEIISKNAQWFEDHSPVDERFKKKTVKGVSAKVITVAMIGGDCYPATPIGINLPNSEWIREVHGSKSVTIENITHAYDQANRGNGMLQEFCLSDEEINLAKNYGFVSGNLHTDLHECLGHGSGQLLPNILGDELKAYGATIEEARADLFALYYIADKKIVDLGLLPNDEAYKAEYNGFIRNGLMTQLTRIKLGDQIEESHMRNRQLIALWAYEHGKANQIIEKKHVDGRTYFVIQDYTALRALFGELLTEVQRIKSEGDFEAAKSLIESYAVNIDQDLHQEVLTRYEKLNLAPYNGFVNPVYNLVMSEEGDVTDVVLDYSEGYADQMLRYSEKHSWEDCKMK